MKLACVLTLFLALCGGLLIAAIARNGSRAQLPGTNDLASLSFQPHPGARLPLDEKLVDENGRVVELGAYFGKVPVIVVLEYLRCTSLCGVTLRNLFGDTLKRLPLQPGRDYQLLAISIDPRDKPDDAAQAAAKYPALLDRGGRGLGLHFLTGQQAAVRHIADTIGFPYRYDALLDAYIHPAGFVVVAPDGLISRYLEGFGASSPDLIAAIGDAEQDRSQAPLARLLVLCHIQGAPLGRWTGPIIAAFTIAEIGAGLTAIGIFVAVRRRRFG
jgi:protein SCO1/2